MKKQFVLAVAMMFNVVFGASLAVSLLSLYLNRTGISLASIGTIFAVGAFSAAILRLAIGVLTDKFVRKKFILAGIIGYIAFALGLVAASETAHFAALNLLMEFSAAIFWTAFSAYFFDIIRKGNEGVQIGTKNVIAYASSALAPVLAGIIAKSMGFNYLFLISAGIIGTSLLFVNSVKETAHVKGSVSITDFKKEYDDIIHIKGFKTIFAVIFLANFVWTFWYIYMPIYLDNAGMPLEKIGLILTAMGGIAAVMQHPMGKFIDIKPAKWILIPGFFAFWLGGMVFFAFQNFYGYLAGRTILGVAADASWWPAIGIFARITPKKEHGGGWALLMSGAAVAYGLAALIGGWLTQYFTIELILKGSGFLSLAIGILMFKNKFLETKGTAELKKHHIMHLNHRQGAHK